MRTVTTCLAASLLLAGCASTPDGPASRGRLVDAATGSPLSDALLLFASGQRVQTDERGRYALRDVAPGSHRVLVMTRGCRSAELDLEVAEPGARREDVPVRLPAPETLPPREPPRDSPGRLLLPEELREMNVSSIGQALRRVAPEMVGSPAAIGGASSLRGRGSPSPAGRTVPVLVVDGIVAHGEDTSLLDRIWIRDVAWLEVLPGAVAGWEFGTGGSGGVIKVQTLRGNRGSDIEPEDCPRPIDWEGDA